MPGDEVTIIMLTVVLRDVICIYKFDLCIYT